MTCGSGKDGSARGSEYRASSDGSAKAGITRGSINGGGDAAPPENGGEPAIFAKGRPPGSCTKASGSDDASVELAASAHGSCVSSSPVWTPCAWSSSSEGGE